MAVAIIQISYYAEVLVTNHHVTNGEHSYGFQAKWDTEESYTAYILTRWSLIRLFIIKLCACVFERGSLVGSIASGMQDEVPRLARNRGLPIDY